MESANETCPCRLSLRTIRNIFLDMWEWDQILTLSEEKQLEPLIQEMRSKGTERGQHE